MKKEDGECCQLFMAPRRATAARVHLCYSAAADNGPALTALSCLALAPSARQLPPAVTERSPLQIGAVLTETVATRSDGRRRVLSTGRNEVERRHDASAHAEMLCLQVCVCVRST